MLGLPREQNLAQNSIDLLTQEYQGTILWERPGRTLETARIGLSGVENLTHIWTLNSRYVNELERLSPRASINTAPLVIPDQFFIYNQARSAEIEKYAIFLGRFTHAKGAVVLAAEWCESVYRKVGFPLVMVGYGTETSNPAEKQIVQMAQEYPSALRISAENGIRERANLLSNAQAAIFPATHDFSPQSLPEAMAAGTPTICTPIEGHTHLAEHGVTSFLIDPLLAGLAEAMIEITTNLSLRFKLIDTAQQLVKSRYSEAAAGPALSELVGELPLLQDLPA